jgi:hypothetical protein
MYDFHREFLFEVDHTSDQIVCCDSLLEYIFASLTRSSTTFTDEYDLLRLIEFRYLEWECREWDEANSRDRDFSVFTYSSDIDEIDFFRRAVEDEREFFWCDSEHGVLLRL